MEEFVKRYKDNDRYTFVRMFEQSIYSGQEHDGYIITDIDRKIKKLVLFVYHPEGSMHYADVNVAERYDG